MKYKLRDIKKDSIVVRIGIYIGGIIISVGILAIVIIYFFDSSKVSLDTVSSYDIPTAVLSIQMIDEIDDINSNVLEYILGEVEEREDFEVNRKEFRDFLNQIGNSQSFSSSTLLSIENLFNQYTLGLISGAFDLYSPEKEKWAIERVYALTTLTGVKLEKLLDSHKESEIADIGIEQDINKILYDDFPGARYYLELVDEAGDIISDINDYVRGDPKAKDRFFIDVQSFEEFLALLKPLEEKSEEIENIKKIEAYFKVLRDGGLEIMEGYDPLKKIEAIENIDSLEHNYLNELERILDDLSRVANRNAFKALENIKSQNNITTFVLIVLISLVFTFSLIIFIYLYTTVSRPIVNLSTAMSELAKGNIEVKYGEGSWRGEIKTMTETFEVFRENIRERERVEIALGEEKEKAEAANRAKSEFLSNMSHEIRTPMNSILGFTEILKGKIKEPQSLSFLNSIHTSGKSLLVLINDILDLSKIEAGKLNLETNRVSLNNFFNDVFTMFESEITNKGLEFEMNFRNELLETVLLDEIRLRQILVNIIGNSVKFTQKGFIRVHIDTVKDDNTLNLTIRVDDSGVGIPKASMDKIFGAFIQKEGQLNSQFGGTGLGLAISSRLISMMGGEINCTSQENEGSSFIINLPNLKISETMETVKEAKEDIHRSFSGEHILIADDVEQNRVLIKGFLEGLGLQFSEAVNGEEVIKKVKSRRPDLILLDMKMPIMDGYETAKVLNEDKVLQKIPKIAVTASAMVKDREIISTICDGFLSKPIDKQLLISHISKLLPSSKIRSTIEAGFIFNEVDESLKKLWICEATKLIKTKAIDEIEEFAERIKIYAKEEENNDILNFSKGLLNSCINMDIIKIKEYLKEIAEISHL